MIIWVIGSFVTLVVTLQMTSASFIDGQFLPVGHDAFYHGRRILDAVDGSFYQFDPRMHVPQGDWITWPWAYDWSLAKAVQALRFVFGATDSTTVLMQLPLILGVVGVSLVVAICAELEVSLSLTLIAALCFSFNGFTQYFGVGALDHHGAEQIATLGTLWLGLRWLARPENAIRAGLTGLGLGLSLGVHAGMFILQIPLLAALLKGWWCGERLPIRSANGLAFGLLAGALMVLLPAATFWQSRFVIYYLSWLHLYVAVGTCLVVTYISRVNSSSRSVSLLALLALALAAPLLPSIMFSSQFVGGALPEISTIDEIQSPFAVARQAAGARRIMEVYTQLVWVAPLGLALCMWMALRAKTFRTAFPWFASVFGLGLLLAQMRFASFGAVFLYLPIIVLCNALIASRPRCRGILLPALAAALLFAYYPTIRYQLFGGKVPAMDNQYASLRPVLPALRAACANDPGVVLAEPGDGHLIRYFTECSVISNNFRLTPLDIEKIRYSLALIAEPVEKMRELDPEVKYVVARLIAPNESPDPVLFKQLLAMNRPRVEGVEALVEGTMTEPSGKVAKFMGVYKLSPVQGP